MVHRELTSSHKLTDPLLRSLGSNLDPSSANDAGLLFSRMVRHLDKVGSCARLQQTTQSSSILTTPDSISRQISESINHKQPRSPFPCHSGSSDLANVFPNSRSPINVAYEHGCMLRSPSIYPLPPGPLPRPKVCHLSLFVFSSYGNLLLCHTLIIYTCC